MKENMLQFLVSLMLVVITTCDIEVDYKEYPRVSAADTKLLHQLENQKNENIMPNVTVAKDGSGQFKTIMEAVNSYPKNHQGRFFIYIKAGVYAEEYVTVDSEKVNILLYGDGPNKTIITGHKSYKDGIKTNETASFNTFASDFIAKSIAFENTAGPERGRAVALLVEGDRSVFFDCAIRGYQDTLYASANRQFYRACEIYGTIDFIFGESTTLIQKSMIIVRMPLPGQENVVVADGRDAMDKPTGIVLHNCEIMPDPTLFPYRLTVKTYLARPWKPFSRAVFIENDIGDLIQPTGYIPWEPKPHIEHCYFAEFGNTGPGAATQTRAKFAKALISREEASNFTAEPWLQASTWLPATGITFDPRFTKAHYD